MQLDQRSIPNSPIITNHIGCKSPSVNISFVITPTYIYTSIRVYYVLSVGSYTSESTLSSCGFSIGYYYFPLLSHIQFHSPFISVSGIQFQHVTSLSFYSVLSAFSISYSDYLIALLLFSMIWYLRFTLSCRFSTFHVVTHTCATSFHYVGTGSQHPDHTQIDSLFSAQQILW